MGSAMKRNLSLITGSLLTALFIYLFLSLLTPLQSCFCFMFWLRGMWDFSFPIRDQTYTLHIGRWSCNHWTVREVLIWTFEEVEFESDLCCCCSPQLSSHHSPFSFSGIWRMSWLVASGSCGQLWAESGQGLLEVIYLDLALWTLAVRTNFSQCPH